ncbi:MAG: class I SAM-dependent rRNA methyltransferase [Chloroflexi bacterium]|nr:class I SAM-dependent rRNA methyltransferase [Chloroflexota bacterium]
MNRPPKIQTQPTLLLLSASGWKDYELLDSGAGKKLERYGPYTFVRPEAQAVWRPALPEERWQTAHAVFNPTSEESGGRWQFRKQIETTWVMQYKGLKFQAHAAASRHMGVFPEQAVHWDWIGERIRQANRPVKVLNLFGYTGLATLAAAEAGAHVTHVDASKKAIGIGRQNQLLSGLQDRPVRWLVDDVYKFVRREVRRGSHYDGLILDPPKFGRGPEGQVWEFFESLPNLLEVCRSLLSRQPLFIVLTAYAIRASALSIYYALQEMVSGLGGELETGELAIHERSAGRYLSTAIFTRWSAQE